MAAAKPMSIFAHYVALCAIAHQQTIRAARENDSDPREVSRLTIALIGKMQRLETIVAELGAGAVFGTPADELGMDEVRRLFPE